MRRISRTIFKMLAPIIGCSLIKGPLEKLHICGRETDHGYESSLTGDTCSDDCRHPSDINWN